MPPFLFVVAVVDTPEHTIVFVFLRHAGARRASVPLAPQISDEDRVLVDNVVKLVEFLSRGVSGDLLFFRADWVQGQ